MKIVLEKVNFIEVILVLNLDFRFKLGSVVFFGSIRLGSYGSVVSGILNGIFENFVGFFIFVVSLFS